MEFSFGDHVLDLDRRELRRGGELVALEPQVCRTATRSPVRQTPKRGTAIAPPCFRFCCSEDEVAKLECRVHDMCRTRGRGQVH